MGAFEHFPYTNFQDLNLNWILGVVKDYVNKVDVLEINFNDLKDYVNSFIQDLDIQTEVDNKLEEMYEDGRLAELIAQFLDMSNLLVFNNIGNLKDASNIINDMTILVLGDNNYKNADNLIYKIRSAQVGDIIDDYNIVSLNRYPSLVAELNSDYNLVARRTNILYGKKVILMGDSLTGGFSQYGTLGKTWLDILTEKYNLDSYNYSVSGSKISTGGDSGSSSNDMAIRIDNILAEHDDCDIFIVEGGANDKNQNVRIGSINSILNDQYIGAIKNIINKIKAKYGEKCKLLFMTTYHRSDTTNTQGHTESDYVEAMQRACALLSVPCFNNYANSGITLYDTQYTPSPYAWADSGLDSGASATYHFSAKAYEYLADVYVNYLNNAYIDNSRFQYVQINDNQSGNNIIWTKQKLNNGSNLITFLMRNKNVTFSTDFSPVYLTDVIEITPPVQIMNPLSYVLDVNVMATGGGYNSCVLHGTQNYQRLGFAVVGYNWQAVGTRTLTFYGHIITLDT